MDNKDYVTMAENAYNSGKQRLYGKSRTHLESSDLERYERKTPKAIGTKRRKAIITRSRKLSSPGGELCFQHNEKEMMPVPNSCLTNATPEESN
ncbi:hypothetical protein Bca101_067759 [Brassica carinata]